MLSNLICFFYILTLPFISKKGILSIDKDSYEIVAITGNSMGWYTALALGGAVSFHDGYHLIQFMGSIMEEDTIGGQIIYPIIDKEWKIDDNLKKKLKQKKQFINQFFLNLQFH